jgi:hypothetical protein
MLLKEKIIMRRDVFHFPTLISFHISLLHCVFWLLRILQHTSSFLSPREDRLPNHLKFQQDSRLLMLPWDLLANVR